jgi:WD repeat-containing protein 61
VSAEREGEGVVVRGCCGRLGGVDRVADASRRPPSPPSSTKAVIETPPGETWQIAFPPAGASPAGATLLAAAGGAANKVVIWSADDATAVAEMLLPDPGDAGARGRDRFVLSVAYSPDGATLACGAADGGVALFDVATGGLLHSLAGHHKPVRSLAFTPGAGRGVAWRGGGAWLGARARLERATPPPPPPDSKTLVTACDDMHVRLYDAAAGALIDALGGHTSWVTAVAPHPSQPFAATSSSDGSVRLWDLTARACVQTAREHGDQVWGVAFSGDGGALASVGDDKAVCVYAAG